MERERELNGPRRVFSMVTTIEYDPMTDVYTMERRIYSGNGSPIGGASTMIRPDLLEVAGCLDHALEYQEAALRKAMKEQVVARVQYRTVKE